MMMEEKKIENMDGILLENKIPDFYFIILYYIVLKKGNFFRLIIFGIDKNNFLY